MPTTPTAGINGSYFFTCALASQCSSSYQAARSVAILRHRHQQSARARAALRWLALCAGRLARESAASCSVSASATKARTISTITLTGRRAWLLHGRPAVPAKLRQKLSFAPVTAGSSTASSCHCLQRSGWLALHHSRPSTTIASTSRATPSPIPAFYQSQRRPSQPRVLTSRRPASIPTYHSVDPHFHAALDMQGGIGVDQQFAKHITGNITYLYTQGVHQYLTNNVTAPDLRHIRLHHHRPPALGLQLPVPVRRFLPAESAHRLLEPCSSRSSPSAATTCFNEAKSDTQGVNSFPSVAQDPGLRLRPRQLRHSQSVFRTRELHLRRMALSSPLCSPRNRALPTTSPSAPTSPATTNSMRAPPTEPAAIRGVVSTQYGCLDTDPSGKDEPHDGRQVLPVRRHAVRGGRGGRVVHRRGPPGRAELVRAGDL